MLYIFTKYTFYHFTALFHVWQMVLGKKYFEGKIKCHKFMFYFNNLFCMCISSVALKIFVSNNVNNYLLASFYNKCVYSI